MNRVVPTSELNNHREPSMERLIRELCDVPSDQWSPREVKIMNSAISHGELYYAHVEEFIGENDVHYMKLSTDLGDPDNKIFLTIPIFVDEKKALEILQRIAEELMV